MRLDFKQCIDFNGISAMNVILFHIMLITLLKSCLK